jgi:hypothetical protein
LGPQRFPMSTATVPGGSKSKMPEHQPESLVGRGHENGSERYERERAYEPIVA